MILGRQIGPRAILGKGLGFLALLAGLVRVKRPLLVLRHYIRQTSPEYVDLRSGNRFFFSSHPHDMVSFCLVFLKREYGGVHKGDIVVDVGANIGSFSIYAALAGASKVYAFEPSLEAFEALSKNVCANHLEGQVIPINKAVTGHSGDVVRFPLNSSPFNTLVSTSSSAGEFHVDRFSGDLREYAIAAAASHEIEYRDVLTISLDDFMAEHAVPFVDFLKLDCEGAEMSIAPALSLETMRSFGKIRMECHVDPKVLLNSFPAGTHYVERMKGAALWLNPSTIRSSDLETRSGHDKK